MSVAEPAERGAINDCNGSVFLLEDHQVSSLNYFWTQKKTTFEKELNNNL